MSDLSTQIQEAVDFIRGKGYDDIPRTALIFGSGLGAMAEHLGIDLEIPYQDIPGFVKTTLEFHKGRLLFFKIGEENIVAMDGRFHYYEGYNLRDVTFPIRVMHALGADKLLLSNISGGLNPEYRIGDLVLINDHINLLGDNPLIGPNDHNLGPRFLDMMEPYSNRLIRIADTHAMKMEIRLHHGVYAVMSGPSFETRAEYRMLRSIGADMIGMSSVPEVIVARHSGMEVLAISLISDECFPECLAPMKVEDLLENARKGSKSISAIFRAVIQDAEYHIQ